MIITRITAGMGNQMFMYSAGLALAQRLGTELKLDLHGFSKESFRKYSLSAFPNITEASASLREIWTIAPTMAIADRFSIRGNSIFKHPFRRLLYEFLSRTGFLETGRAARKKRQPGNIFAPIPFSRVYFSPDFSYHKEFTQLQDNTYILGCWESEKFFAGIADLVRQKFAFSDKHFPDPELSRRVRTCNSVALHVRRGDKALADKSFASNAYYLKSALQQIHAMTDEPQIFVVSDGMDWCRENLPKIYEADYDFVGGNFPAQDMALMTICRHVIAAPSTFSWWGAWLNANPNKIIIVPDINLWHEDIHDRKDLLPDSWLKIR